MRAFTARFCLGLACILVMSWPLCAQAITQPTLARNKTTVAVVRGAPGENSPETGRLPQGSLVTVMNGEGNDWLAIQPPMGSISWINWALIEPQKKQGHQPLTTPFLGQIVTENRSAALIRAGKPGENKPLNVHRTKLPEGTIVQVLGPKVKLILDGDSTETNWYPINAPADDYRYLRRDEVEWTGTPVTAGFVVKDGQSSAKPMPGVVAVPTGKGTGDFTMSVNGESNFTKPSAANWDPNYHPLFREAEKARGSGDTARAEKLYQRVAEDVGPAGPKQDTDLANLCYDRIFLMKQGASAGSGSGTSSGSAWQPSAERSPSVERSPSLKAPTTLETKTTKEAEGYLRDSRYRIGGRVVYLLYDQKGVLRHYAVSGGISLDKYLGKFVTLAGEETKPEELRGDPLLEATQVKSAR